VELGFRALLPLEQALAWTVAWHKAHLADPDPARTRARCLEQIAEYQGMQHPTNHTPRDRA